MIKVEDKRPKNMRCNLCKYFVPHSKEVNEELRGDGRCHRFPPFVNGEYRIVIVYVDDWCGEWKTK